MVGVPDEVGDRGDDACGTVRVELHRLRRRDAREHQDRLQTRLETGDDVVSIRSPIIRVFSEWAPILRNAERIISGFGLPT